LLKESEPQRIDDGFRPSESTGQALSVTTVENDFVSDVYHRISSWYDLFFGPTLHAGRLEAIQKLPIQSGDEILEVGIGTGINAALYPKDCSVKGIDFSAAMLRKASKRISANQVKNVELIKMDAAALEFDDESFDLVYAPYVISVVTDPIKVAREMYRVCRVGGHIVVLNHFRSEHPVLSKAEKVLSPLTVHIGFRADLDLSGFLSQADLNPISVEKVNIPKMWSLITIRKDASV
tara:strand:+ start:1324 stop:2031 length:708 start_codon:yes stop_codon:yes gene_type:complete